MRKIFILAFSLVAIGITSCKKNKNKSPENKDVIVESDPSALKGRVSTSEAGVIFVDPSLGGQKKTTVDSSSNEYPLELVASVTAPAYQGNTLMATHVEINGNYAYVSYNTQGNPYIGAIDVFNISTITTPQLVASVTLPSTDISAIAYYNNRLYVAGAKDVSATPNATPAIIGYIPLTNGVPASSATLTSASYNGFVATGITESNGKLYLTTGTNGGFYEVNPSTLAQVQSITVADARSVAANGTYIAVQSGSAGVNIYNPSTYTLVRNISLGTDVAEAKRTMDFKNNYLIIANGLGGMKYYDVTTGTKMDEIILPTTLPGVANSADLVSNGVSYNSSNGLIFGANGAAGTYVCKENTNTHTLDLVGSFNFGVGNSSNYVKSKDNYVFLAAGKGGLKIMKFTPPTASCTGLSNYTGNNNLNVNTGQTLQYSGSVSLHTVAVNGNLFYCGSMAVSQNLNINNGGTMNVQGALSFGSNNKTMHVNGTLKVQGNLTIYGDLNLNSGAKIEFIGTNNTVTIYGSVTKGSNVTITGTYNDVNNKL